MSKPLKSALKKGPSSAGPSKSSASAGSKGKGKGAGAKHSVSLATKGERFKGPDLESESEGNASGFDGEDVSDVEMGAAQAEGEEMDTDEEIEHAQDGKVKKVVKRKREPTTASTFGDTLTTLLADPLTQKSRSKKPKPTPASTAQAPILALSAHKPPARATVSLEAKARRAMKAEKEEKEDRARVRDVVEGWAGGDGVLGGQEFERGLRKTAQRGVIKLFNAILQASKNAEEANAHSTLAAQAKLKPEQAKRKEKDNILGRGGKEDVLTKESFLDMVRKGSTR